MKRDHLDQEALAGLIERGETALDDAQWEHLATCPDCHASYADALRTLHSWHAGANDLPVPNALLRVGRGIAGAGSPASGLRPQSRRNGARLGLLFGGLAVAASLVGVLLLPPTPAGRFSAARGPGEPVFVRPVEGEVLPARHRRLEWRGVPGATGYQVQLRDDEGTTVWEGGTELTVIRLPGYVKLESRRNYKALLTVRPPDLLPPGGASVAFRTGPAWESALQRVRRPDLRAFLLGVAGLGLAVLGAVRHRVAL